jgi:hypothetical protein
LLGVKVLKETLLNVKARVRERLGLGFNIEGS